MMVRNLGSVAKIYGSLQMLVGFFLGSICISNKGYVEGIILGVEMVTKFGNLLEKHLDKLK